MSTHYLVFMENLQRLSFNYHQIPTKIRQLSGILWYLAQPATMTERTSDFTRKPPGVFLRIFKGQASFKKKKIYLIVILGL